MRGARRRRCTRATRRRAARDARKAIVLLNRRGWSNFLTCRACGKVVGVPAAATSRSCCTAPSARSPATTAATASACRGAATRCGSLAVARHGAGTERLEPSSREALDVPVFRLDADAGATKDASAAAAALRAPRRAGCCSARRWSPRATTSRTSTLGVVLDADATLRFPDFRAEERTFALIAQLAGRAGRGPARRPRARADARARRAVDRRRRAPRRRRLPRGRARAPAGARATRRSPT